MFVSTHTPWCPIFRLSRQFSAGVYLSCSANATPREALQPECCNSPNCTYIPETSPLRSRDHVRVEGLQ